MLELLGSKWTLGDGTFVVRVDGGLKSGLWLWYCVWGLDLVQASSGSTRKESS